MMKMSKPSRPYYFKDINPDFSKPELKMTLKSLVLAAAGQYKDNTAYRTMRGGELVEISFRQFAQDVRSLGGALLAKGYSGVKIALVGDNSYHWVVAHFAATTSGNIIVPIDKDLPAADTMAILRSSGAEVLFCAAGNAASAQEAAAAGVGYCCDLEDAFAALLRPGDTAAGQKYDAIDPEPDDLAAILYTSGTTGNPKGVMLSHLNLVSDITSGLTCVDNFGEGLLVLPLHHCFPFLDDILAGLSAGFACNMSRGMRWMMQELQRYKPRHLIVVPLYITTFHKQIAATLKAKNIEDIFALDDATLAAVAAQVRGFFGGELRLIFSGGAALDPYYIDFFGALGINILHGYGTTECAPVVTINLNLPGNRHPGSVGLPLSICEIKIVDPDPDGIGRVCVRGSNVMQGYHNMPAETAKALDPDGWYRSDDYGYLDADGYLYLSGRTSNLIVLSNGKNVYPEEIETLLLRMPYVLETVIHEENDRLAAEIFPDMDAEGAQSLGLAEVRVRIEQSVQEYNAGSPIYKNINRVHFREEPFPKTASKKIKRASAR